MIRESKLIVEKHRPIVGSLSIKKYRLIVGLLRLRERRNK